MSIRRPVTTQPHYGRHLGDVEYWSPYVTSVLDRHGMLTDHIEAPFVGTFPTFLAGEVVVKLFGDIFDGATCFATELAMATLLEETAEIPAPRLIASGQLFGEDQGRDWAWPYLITERLRGTAIRDAEGPRSSIVGAAAELGRAVSHLHRLRVPAGIADDRLPRLRAGAVDRQRRQGLPERLVEEIPSFLADASDDRVLVHADLTADHLFLDDHGLVGIIDWADAFAADPWYELVAVRLDGLQNDQELFDTFLEAYGWEQEDDFAVRSLQGALEFEYDTLQAAVSARDLSGVTTLEELAEMIFG